MRLMRMLRMSKLRAVWERVEVRIGSIAIIQSIMRLRVDCEIASKVLKVLSSPS